MDDRTYRNIQAAIAEGRIATSGQAGQQFTGTPEEQERLRKYAAAVKSGDYASVDNIEAFLKGGK